MGAGTGGAGAEGVGAGRGQGSGGRGSEKKGDGRCRIISWTVRAGAVLYGETCGWGPEAREIKSKVRRAAGWQDGGQKRGQSEAR